MQPINILADPNRVREHACVEVAGERELEKNTINVVVLVQVVDEILDCPLPSVSHEVVLCARYADTLARRHLVLDVEPRGGVISNANNCEERMSV